MTKGHRFGEHPLRCLLSMRCAERHSTRSCTPLRVLNLPVRYRLIRCTFVKMPLRQPSLLPAEGTGALGGV